MTNINAIMVEVDGIIECHILRDAERAVDWFQILKEDYKVTLASVEIDNSERLHELNNMTKEQ